MENIYKLAETRYGKDSFILLFLNKRISDEKGIMVEDTIMSSQLTYREAICLISEVITGLIEETPFTAAQVLTDILNVIHGKGQKIK